MFKFAKSALVAVLVLAGLLFGGGHLIAHLGTTVTHLSCVGTAKQTGEGDVTLFPDTRLGIRVEQYGALVFWAEESRRLSFSMAYAGPNGPTRRWAEKSLPLDVVNETYFTTEFASGDDPQFFFDNLSGYVGVLIPDDSLVVEFDGFCGVFEPAFQ